MVCRDERIKKKQRNEVLNQLSGQWKVIIKQLMFAYYYTNYYLKDVRKKWIKIEQIYIL